MIALFRKEFNAFFSSPIAYLVIGLFLVVNSLLLWVFKGEFNILDSGIASLQGLFRLAPWVLLLLVPAVTMRSFSEERNLGTLEVLLTKPIAPIKIVLGKYLGALFLVLLAIIPTFIYCFALGELKTDQSSLDYGSILGGFLGLLLLTVCYAAIGIFASAISTNQIVAFVTAVFIGFLFFFGFQGLSNLSVFGDLVSIEHLGLSYHYNSMGRGVIDTRNVIYFLSLAGAFLSLTKVILIKR